MNKEIQSKIFNFIEDNYIYPLSGVELENDTSLLDNEILDSTGIIELVSFIESEFHISVNDGEIIPSNMDSVEKITKFVKGKQNEL